MAKSKKDFTLLLIALFCSSLAHAQKQVPTERKDSIDNGSNTIKIVGNHSNKGAANNALDVLSGQAAGVNVTSNGLAKIVPRNRSFIVSFSIFFLFIQPIVNSSISDNSAVPITQLHFFNDNTYHIPFYAPSDTFSLSQEGNYSQSK